MNGHFTEKKLILIIMNARCELKARNVTTIFILL